MQDTCVESSKARIRNSSFFRVLKILRIEFVVLALHETIFENSAFEDSQFGKSASGFSEFSKKVFENSNSIN